MVDQPHHPDTGGTRTTGAEPGSKVALRIAVAVAVVVLMIVLHVTGVVGANTNG